MVKCTTACLNLVPSNILRMSSKFSFQSCQHIFIRGLGHANLRLILPSVSLHHLFRSISDPSLALLLPSNMSYKPSYTLCLAFATSTFSLCYIYSSFCPLSASCFHSEPFPFNALLSFFIPPPSPLIFFPHSI